MAADESKLLALFKLAFYKKKKNWKLPEDVRKKVPSSANITLKLNKTYVLEEPEPELVVEHASSHDEVFQEGPDPTDVEVDPQLRDDEPPSRPSVEHRIENRQGWCGMEAEGVRTDLTYDICDGPVCGGLWRPDPASTLVLIPAVDPLDHHLECLTPEELRQTAGDWLMLNNYLVNQEECASEDHGFEDESADFVRGFHYAPHSTEIDLSITQEFEIRSNNLYGLPERQLAQAIRKHHYALTLLLSEQALRESMRSSFPLHPPLPSEEFLMRDTDSLQPECVLSSSHSVASATGYDADTGRGRGRLQQRRRVGIEKGRPYWL